MTPYQRGGRDALLAAAAWIEAQRTGRVDHRSAIFDPVAHRLDCGDRALSSVVATLRRRAEALPEDPEVPCDQS